MPEATPTPHVAGTVLQTPVQQRQVARGRDAADNRQAHGARQMQRAVEQTDTSIETSDSDTRVNADSSGLAGQGRHLPTDDQPAPEPPDDDDGITTDEQGHVHLDIQA